MASLKTCTMKFLLTCLLMGIISIVHAQAVLDPSFPANAKICTGTNASFAVHATATGTISYQWQESTDGGTSWNSLVEGAATGANPSNGIYTGTTSPVLTITRAPSTMNGNKYRSVVKVNGINAVNSVNGTLNVGPDVSLDAATSVNCPGTSNTLNTAAAAGVSYQWQVSSNSGSSWANVTDGADASGVAYSGGAGAALLISSLAPAINGYQYRYIANDGMGCVITSGATTQQVPALAVFAYPAASTISAAIGSSVNIPITISAGTGPFTYQWQVAVGAGSFSNISSSNTTYSGATSSTLVIPSVTSAIYSNRYRVIVRNAGSCVTSSSSFAQVSVDVTLPLAITDLRAETAGSGMVRLSWTTATPDLIQRYIVERSAATGVFEERGTVAGERARTQYSYLDATGAAGNFQYRVKMQSKAGNFFYSDIVRAGAGASYRIGLRPSVISVGSAHLVTDIDQRANLLLTVSDVAGRIEWVKTLDIAKGQQTSDLDLSSLSKGIYFLRVTGQQGIFKTIPFIRN
jgi:hypothetical protein